MYYIPVKLCELPLWRLSKGLKIVSYTGKLGTVDAVEYTASGFILHIYWENGTVSIQNAENLTQVYALVYDAGITAAQQDCINQINSRECERTSSPKTKG